MIYCVALNPAIDRTIEIHNFQVGQTCQARQSRVACAGKGVNVAFTLNALNVAAEIIAWVGKNDLAAYQEALGNLRHTLLPVAQNTRNNTTIIDPVRQTETHLREPGFQIQPENWRALQELLPKKVRAGDWVIFTGSLPPGTPIEGYRDLIQLVQQQHARAVLDSSGAALRHGVTREPWLLKINQPELAELTGQDLTDPAGIIQIARRYLTKMTPLVVITLGREGALGMHANQTYWTRISESFVSGLNTVGCGDAFLGGLVAALSQDQSLEQALILANACGAVNTFAPAAGRIQSEHLQACLPLVTIDRLVSA
ncbi:1-phosphofructokinase family hexose kinase [candidate division KSB1 bacterium]|nr:1-phosphofructokinase family hexose kinase [candidate division KSB1 bacterium]